MARKKVTFWAWKDGRYQKVTFYAEVPELPPRRRRRKSFWEELLG